MSQAEKLLKRFLTAPKDFSWQELQKMLSKLGYRESQSGSTSGSRVKFVHNQFAPIALHKPHPSPYLKRYQLQQIGTALKERGQI